MLCKVFLYLILLLTSSIKFTEMFFWKKSLMKNGLPLIAWDRVRKPKVKGGLGLQRLEAINEAFQCKLAWRILKNEHMLCAQSMKAKYLSRYELLQCNSKCADSLIGRNVLKCWNLLQQGIMWKVGKGDKISFWFDNWIENRSLIDMLELHSHSVC